MMKDEGPALLEWLAYHRLIGFDRICVYTNDCSDGTDAMLLRLEEMGEVLHFRNDVPAGKKPQPNAMKLAERNPAATDTDWVVAMDADEFVSIKTGDGTLPALMAHIPDDAQGIVMTWRFFGSSGLVDWNPGLVTESYIRAAPDRFRKGWGVKTLFRPFDGFKFGIHRPRIKGARHSQAARDLLRGQAWVNGSGKPMHPEFTLNGWRSTGTSLGYDLVELNHYAVKSHEAYLLRRLRGNVNNKDDKYNANYFAIFDRNEIRADNAARHAPAVKARIAQWLTDPTLARLHAEAMAFHADRVARLRQTEDYGAWLDVLKKAGRVPIHRLDEVLFTKHLPREWQDHVAKLRAQGVPDRQIALAIARATGTKREERRTALPDPARTKPKPAQSPSGALDGATVRAVADGRSLRLVRSAPPDPAPEKPEP